MVLELFLAWESIDTDSMTNYTDHISGNNQIVNSPNSSHLIHEQENSRTVKAKLWVSTFPSQLYLTARRRSIGLDYKYKTQPARTAVSKPGWEYCQFSWSSIFNAQKFDLLSILDWSLFLKEFQITSINEEFLTYEYRNIKILMTTRWKTDEGLLKPNIHISVTGI